MSNSKEKRKKRAAPFLKFYKKLEQACDTYDDIMQWYDLVAEFSGLLSRYSDVIPVQKLQATIDQVNNLTDTSRFGIETACKILRRDLKSAIEDFAQERIESLIQEQYGTQASQIASGISKTTIMVIGGGGGSAALAAGVVALSIIGQFDFGIQAGNDSVSVIQGDTISVPITVTIFEGSPKNVNLSCSTSSADLSCSLDSFTVYPNLSRVVNLNLLTTQQTRSGQYSVTVTAESDNIIKQGFVTLFVEQQCPETQPETQPLIVLRTDKSVYISGHDMILTAVVSPAYIGSFINFKICNDNKIIMEDKFTMEDKTRPDSEFTGIFQKVINLEGPEWHTVGEEYKIIAEYDSQTAEITIYTSNFGATVEFDKSDTVATGTLTSVQDPGQGHESHQLAIILAPSDKVYKGILSYSASENIQLVALHGPLAPGEDAGQAIWTVDGTTKFALTFVDPENSSGEWMFSGNALAVHTMNTEPFTVDYSVSFTESAPSDTAKSGTLTSAQDPGQGHETHQLAIIIPPSENFYSGILTYSASENIQLVSLRGPIEEGEEMGQLIWTPDGITKFGLTLVDPQNAMGSWEFTGNALAVHTMNTEPFQVSYSVGYMELDPVVYTWTDKVFIIIVAPDHNHNSDLIEEIGDVDHKIVVATRGSKLENYKLVETGTDTGIFTGEVILTGFTSHDADGDGNTGDASGITSGHGPNDGFLAVDNEDGLTVSFEFKEYETVVGSALIRWNIGEASWLETSYPATGTGVVRIVDPDMNLNPETVDSFEINVWSDSDAGGIDLTVTETNEATGIFEADVVFTQTQESSENRLRVSEGDTIYAEYDDRTLPEPYSILDKHSVTATSFIGSG